MDNPFAAVIDAFPAPLKADASTVAVRLVQDGGWRAFSDGFAVIVSGEAVTIPYRLYIEEVVDRSTYSPTELAVLDCLQTRHHNGYVRERALGRILTLNASWSVPFVIQLVAEYVVQILHLIESRWAEVDARLVGRFLVANQAFHSLVRQRVNSYWNCYYRRASPNRRDYVGQRLLNRLDEAVESVDG